ncbi:hypothetical protein EDC04DRAFT_2615640 [Pisolithus marmoratus]|nr:hypothetical protein EDC04DRAFT_2615640 [Pisolithus marmoratus]
MSTATYKEFGDDKHHDPQTAEHTLDAISALCSQADPDDALTKMSLFLHCHHTIMQHGKFPISGDTDIDNISPNEDKRMAEAALHTPEPDLRSESANFYSIPSCAPTLELAYHGQDKQDSQSLVATHPADSQIDPVLLAISEQHYAQSSQLSPGSPGPPMMVVLTADVIEHAKLIAQCNSATKNPFPPCSTFLDILSGEIFNEALVKCMNTPPGYWPNYCSQLGILGSTNNMAHPALVALVMDFFYSPSSIGSVFPEVFSHEVPRVAMCLAATALRAALDGYSQTGIQQDCPFEYGTYSKIFAGFLDMQHQINQHPRHSVKTQELRVAWASAGRAKTHSKPVIAFSDEFHIVLD